MLPSALTTGIARAQDLALSVWDQGVNRLCALSALNVCYVLWYGSLFETTLILQHISTRPPSRPGLMRQVKVGGLSGGAGGRGKGRRDEQPPSDTAEEDAPP